MTPRLLLSALALCACLKAAVIVEKTSYKNFHDCYRVSNGQIELIYVADVGPRVIRFGFVGGQNMLKEMSDAEEERFTGGQDWNLYGGHRIWVGPEEPSYTYSADNEPVAVETGSDWVRGAAPADSVGIRKAIEVRMSDDGEVTLTHRLTNESAWPLEFAAWALTMMAPGGSGISTFPPRGTHPEHLLPSNPLVMWRFTNLSDPRWKLFEKYVVLQNIPAMADPEKIGLYNADTRGAYLLGSDLFVKRYRATAESDSYPDMGASYETFTNDLFLEIETLGPVEQVAPGETIEHVETWRLHKGVALSDWTEAELDRVLAPLLR